MNKARLALFEKPSPHRAQDAAPARGASRRPPAYGVELADSAGRIHLVQAKRTAGAVTDPLEGEADRVADQVLRAPAGGAPLRAAGADPAATLGHAGSGRPLDEATRAFFEPRFGADFSHVRIHTGDEAARSAKAAEARAYTLGRDIVFGTGEYAPETPGGKQLLAHELAHTVQQQEGEVGAPLIQRWDSPEHVELGETATGPGGGYILLECFQTDFPERTQPMAAWPRDWRDLYNAGTPEQKRALTQGLTYGEIVALNGDFYPDFQTLNHASLRELIRLIPLIRGRATTEQLQAATGGRYLALAQQNERHFSNVRPGFRNIDTWRSAHAEAIQLARQGNANMAWATNAAADHFLTDAFSGGHLRTPRSQLMGSTLGNIESKILHDLDNEHGMEVTNRRGDRPWIAYGDDFLTDPRNVQNRALAIEAVRLSRQDIAGALAQGTAYPAPAPGTTFAAEPLVPFPVNPSADRWTGRVPTYTMGPGGPVRQMDDYTMTRNRIVANEAPGILAGFFNDDNQIRSWVRTTELPAIGRQPASEKIRMINVLLDGWVDESDMVAIERICSSVTTEAEMRAIRDAIEPRAISLGFGQRTRLRIALSRRP